MKDRKQFISFEHNSTKEVTVTCGIPKGSILGPLLFLLYVNYLHHALKILNPIVFANNTNLAFLHSYIYILFEQMNKELINVSNCLMLISYVKNNKKTKYSFFHKSSKQDNIPLQPSNLNINGFTNERESSTTFLEVWIDKNLTWRDHIHTIENKIAKNIGLLYQGKHYVDDKCLK